MFLQSSVETPAMNTNGGSESLTNGACPVMAVSRFCLPVCARDAGCRQLALDRIEKTVQGWLDGYGSPKHQKVDSSAVEAIGNGHLCPEEYLALVRLHLPVMLRLSQNCPFLDVRDKCLQILRQVQERGLPVPTSNVAGPSAYIPHIELPPLGALNDQTQLLFVDAFLQNNRLDHVTQVMGFHPTYLDVFLRTQSFILRGDGPLSYDYRHLIAIMAAGRHQCSYLINLQKQEFLLQGGDSSWLKGLSSLPQKLRDLYEINKIMAHRPWLLNKSHIEKLTKGKDSWSLAEVVHAIVLLAHFHSLASFVFGCGVNEELDQDGGFRDDVAAVAAAAVAKPTTMSRVPTGGSGGGIAGQEAISCEVGVETLMQRMKSLSEQSEEFSQEEKTKRFEHVESQSVELSPKVEPPPLVKSEIGHFVDDPTFLYQDFARRGEVSDIPTFRVQDYSWDDHGYSLVNRLYNDVGNLLDDKFKTAYNLTYFTMGGRTHVDTSRFRRAIWNYIQCMFGIRHDDYDYGEVNQLIERSLKSFIKSACCFPERVTKADYDNVLREFQHSEKVHVNLMVLEARMQAEMLYALKAVMRYMT